MTDSNSSFDGFSHEEMLVIARDSNLQKLINGLLGRGNSEDIERLRTELVRRHPEFLHSKGESVGDNRQPLKNISPVLSLLYSDTEKSVLKTWSELNRPPPNRTKASGTDDPAAYQLLMAAELLVERKDWKRAERVLKLISAEFRGTAEADLARNALKNFDKYRQ